MFCEVGGTEVVVVVICVVGDTVVDCVNASVLDVRYADCVNVAVEINYTLLFILYYYIICK